MRTTVLKDDYPMTQAFSQSHNGMDIATNQQEGKPVYAHRDGVVMYAGPDQYNGLYIWIKHDDGTGHSTVHHRQLLVSRGQRVTKGQLIAYSGSTGKSTGPHVHITTMSDGTNYKGFYDPRPEVEIKGEPANTALTEVAKTDSVNLNSLSVIARDIFKYSDWDKQSAWDRVLSYNPHLWTGNYAKIYSERPIYMPVEVVPAPPAPPDQNVPDSPPTSTSPEIESLRKEIADLKGVNEKLYNEIESLESGAFRQVSTYQEGKLVASTLERVE